MYRPRVSRVRHFLLVGPLLSDRDGVCCFLRPRLKRRMNSPKAAGLTSVWGSFAREAFFLATAARVEQMADELTRYEVRAYIRRLRGLETEKLDQTDMQVTLAMSEREANAFQEMLIRQADSLWERLSVAHQPSPE
jgi:hypothetical protein